MTAKNKLKQHMPDEVSANTNQIDLARAAINVLQQPLVICDAANRIIQANYAAEIFFGASQQVLFRLTIDEMFAFGSPVIDMVNSTRDFYAPMTKYRLDVALLRSKIEIKSDVFCAPILELEGAVSLMLQERTIADKLDRQLDSQGAVKSASGLASMLAHEIKNPLSGIRGAAQLLEQTVAPDEQQLARLIRDETDRIVKLIDRVEVFGDQRPAELHPTNIHAVLHRVKLLAQSGVAKGIRIIEKLDPSLPLLNGNEDQLIQVFINLIKNAAEAFENKQEARIKISTAYRTGVRIGIPGSGKHISLPLEVTIQDNGPGIRADIRPFMFDPFVTSKTNGSGLGLPLVAKIVADHGGIVECESKPGKTLFRVLLRVAPPQRVSASVKEAP